QLDLAGVAQAEAILGKPKYVDKPVVRDTLKLLHQKIVESPFRNVYTLDYAQGPTSIDAAVDYLERRYGDADSAAGLMPRVLLATGLVVVLALGFVVIRLVRRRRQPHGGS